MKRVGFFFLFQSKASTREREEEKNSAEKPRRRRLNIDVWSFETRISNATIEGSYEIEVFVQQRRSKAIVYEFCK